MQVPVRRAPNTRVSEQQQGYAKGTGLDLSPITRGLSEATEVVEGFRQQLKDEQRGRQKLEANKRLMQEVNELQEDFERRKRDPQFEPMNFADATELAYSTRHNELLEEYRKKGFDSDIIDDLDLKLGSVRQGFFERGLGHQLSTLRSRAYEEVEELGVLVSQYVTANPDGYASGEQLIRETVNSSPDLIEEEKEAKIDELIAVARNGGAKALSIQDPDLIISSFDPQGLTAPYRPTTTSGSRTVATAPTNSWQGVATTVANELDLDPTEVAAVMSYETAGTFSPTIKGGKGGNYMGLIQFGRPERKKYGITETSTPQEWSTAILSFMRDRGFKKGMSLLDFYSTINAGSPGRYNASDGPGNTVRGHVNKLLREHKGKAAQWLAAVEPAAEAVEGEALVMPAPATQTPLPQTIAEVQTGNPLLDALSGPERLQALGWAREQQGKVLATRKAEMDVTIGNITAEALNNGGEIATPLPSQEEVLQIYGPVEGPQRWAQIQQSKDTGQAMQAFRTQSMGDIQRGLEALKPEPGSPTYETELKIYEAAERAASAISSERDKDPAAYAMKYFPSLQQAAAKGTAQYYAELDRVYQHLGIDPKYAPVLPAQAMERLIQDYKTMSPEQRRKYMQDNFLAMGEDRFIRFTSNMEGTTAQDDARIFALMRGYRGTPAEWQNVYQQVLEGREIMAQDPARRPSNEEFTKQFRGLGAQALTNLNAQASRAIQEATIALYVARGGKPDKPDAALYKESLAIALGGSLPVNMGKGRAQDYTILPSKATRERFEAWQESLTFEKITNMSVEKRPPRYGDLKTPVPIEDIIDEGVFVMTSPRHYMIKMASDGRPLMTSTGRPFIVNIRPRDIP